MGPFSDDWSLEVQRRWLEMQLSRLDLFYYLNDLDRMAALGATIEPALAAVGTVGHRTDFMIALASMATRQEQYTLSPKTVDLWRAALAATRETEDPARIAFAQFGVGFAQLWSGAPSRAATPLLAGLELAEQVGVAYTEVLCLTYLACAYRLLGDTPKARRYGERSLAATEQVDMPTYRAAAYANLACLAWHDGVVEEAETRADQALSTWDDYPYPFRWLASWVLLAIHTQLGELADAVEAARDILHPSQRRQPDDLPDVLRTAVASWETHDPGAVQTNLETDTVLAGQYGYL